MFQVMLDATETVVFDAADTGVHTSGLIFSVAGADQVTAML
jgi:hypothetical protein